MLTRADKSFSTQTDAEAFLRNEAPKDAKAFYAVRSGRAPGVYTDWPTAQAQVANFKRAKYRKFGTRAEADAFVAGDADSADQGPAKRPKRSSATPTRVAAGELPDPGYGALPADAEDDFDRTILLNAESGAIEYKTEAQLQATKRQAAAPDGPLHIYTDGSALGNGQLGSVAGVGVYFGPRDARNVSEPLAGARQTNQRAELTGLQRAVDLAPVDRDVVIFSDSNYAIKCVTEWSHSWKRNGWMAKSGKPVENRDLVEPVLQRLQDRDTAGATTRFVWTKGHANDPGNVAADRLAVAGSHKARALLAAGVN